jgi:anti-sigma regulatory factor (Ser/Thr protein kinase)
VTKTELELQQAMTSPRTARLHAASFLGEQHRKDLVPDASLIVTELVTNAVLHGGEPIRLAVDMDALLRIGVFDGDRRTEHVAIKPHDMARPGGRGLHIVSTLADRWGTDAHPDGKTVWAELARPIPH